MLFEELLKRHIFARFGERFFLPVQPVGIFYRFVVRVGLEPFQNQRLQASSFDLRPDLHPVPNVIRDIAKGVAGIGTHKLLFKI